VQTGEEALDDKLGPQVQTGDLTDNLGLQIFLGGAHGAIIGFPPIRHRQPVLRFFQQTLWLSPALDSRPVCISRQGAGNLVAWADGVEQTETAYP
jgi:hypothetical protein